MRVFNLRPKLSALMNRRSAAREFGEVLAQLVDRDLSALGGLPAGLRALADDDDSVAAAAARRLDDEVLALAELLEQRVDLEEAAADGDRRRDRDTDRL